MNNPAQAKWIKTIHVAKRTLQIPDEQYRAILFGAANVNHANEITTWDQYNAVLTVFKKHGFAVRKSVKKQLPNEPRDPNMITIRQEYYIKGLWDLASRKKDEKSLRAIIQRIAKVDDISFLKKEYATSVILALRDITSKAGFDPNNP